jgi:hypothetical protein
VLLVLCRAPHDVGLVSSNPFDVVGTVAAGMQAVWTNRPAEPFDTLAPPPPDVIGSLTGIQVHLQRGRPARRPAERRPPPRRYERRAGH